MSNIPPPETDDPFIRYVRDLPTKLVFGASAIFTTLLPLMFRATEGLPYLHRVPRGSLFLAFFAFYASAPIVYTGMRAYGLHLPVRVLWLFSGAALLVFIAWLLAIHSDMGFGAALLIAPAIIAAGLTVRHALRPSPRIMRRSDVRDRRLSIAVIALGCGAGLATFAMLDRTADVHEPLTKGPGDIRLLRDSVAHYQRIVDARDALRLGAIAPIGRERLLQELPGAPAPPVQPLADSVLARRWAETLAKLDTAPATAIQELQAIEAQREWLAMHRDSALINWLEVSLASGARTDALLYDSTSKLRRSIYGVYNRARHTAIIVFAVTLAVMLSMLWAVRTPGRRTPRSRRSPSQLRESLRFGSALVVILAIPMLAPIDERAIDPADPFRFANWYLPSFVGREFVNAPARSIATPQVIHVAGSSTFDTTAIHIERFSSEVLRLERVAIMLDSIATVPDDVIADMLSDLEDLKTTTTNIHNRVRR